MATDYADIADALKTTIQTVTGAGTLYDYDRRVEKAEDWAAYTSTIDGVSQIRGWDILAPDDDWEPTYNRGGHNHTLRFVLAGYQTATYSPNTYRTFRVIAEEICRAVRQNTSLGLPNVIEVLPPWIRHFGPGRHGLYRLYVAEIVVDVVVHTQLTLS